MSILSIIVLVQGLFLGVTLLFRKIPDRASRIFSAFLITFALTNINDIAFESKLLYFYPIIEALSSPLYLLLPPLLYLYTLSITKKKVSKSRHWMHFIPFALLLLSEIWSAVTSVSVMSRQVSDLYKNDYGYFSNTGTKVLSVYSSIYLVLCLRQVYSDFKVKELENFGYHVGDIKLLRNLLMGLTVFWLAWSASIFFESYPVYIIAEVIVVLYTYALAYFYIVQPNIVSDYAIAERDRAASPISVPKYEKSVLTEERADFYKLRLIEIMKSEEPYLNPDLSLGQLADLIKLPPYHLSQVLNVHFGQSFFDFVNYYRVEEVKRNLCDERKKHLTMLGIGLDAGFNSKSAFNQAFKKVTGMTPSSYKKMVVDGVS